MYSMYTIGPISTNQAFEEIFFLDFFTKNISARMQCVTTCAPGRITDRFSGKPFIEEHKPSSVHLYASVFIWRFLLLESI